MMNEILSLLNILFSSNAYTEYVSNISYSNKLKTNDFIATNMIHSFHFYFHSIPFFVLQQNHTVSCCQYSNLLEEKVTQCVSFYLRAVIYMLNKCIWLCLLAAKSIASLVNITLYCSHRTQPLDKLVLVNWFFLINYNITFILTVFLNTMNPIKSNLKKCVFCQEILFGKSNFICKIATCGHVFHKNCLDDAMKK